MSRQREQTIQALVRRQRRLTDELVKVTTGLEKLAAAASLPRAPPPPLYGTARAAAEFIAANPHSKGQTVAYAIHVKPFHFRQYIVPRLKLHGFESNRPGYVAPPGWHV